MRGTPPTIWIVALLMASCGESCCDPDVHLCHFTLEPDGGGVDSATPNFASAECVAPSIVDEPCMDDFEPNDDFVLGAWPTAPECGLTSHEGQIGARDIDVFRTRNCDHASSSDGFDDALTPWAESSDEIRLCIFPTCSDGSTRVLRCLATEVGKAPSSDAESGSDNLANSSLGFHGCCREGAGRITAVLDCSLASKTLDTFIWVAPLVQGEACHGYSVSHEIE